MWLVQNSIGEAFMMGGGWMYSIALFGLVFYVLVIAQFIKLKKVDYTPILWGLLFSMALLGPLGSAVGINVGGIALEAHHPGAPAGLGDILEISMYPTIFSTILSVIGAILLGIAAFKTKRARA